VISVVYSIEWVHDYNEYTIIYNMKVSQKIITLRLRILVFGTHGKTPGKPKYTLVRKLMDC